MAGTIIDIDLAKDVKDFINNSDDVTVDGVLKDVILTANDDKLLRVEKTIASPTKILKVDVVDAIFDG